MVRLALPNTPYVEPATGKAVEGRMQVYLHGTNTHAPLYVRPAAEYIEAANPQLIHAGLPYATLFTPLGVFDVVIEKYIGPEGEMSVYSPDSDFEQVGDYETGIDFDIESMARNTVDTVADLREVNPDLKMVTVKCYATDGDCPPRTYVWDATSENQEDGGYVIGSDVSDSGKWILMWDDEVLPCTVYGVKPGTEANTSLLLDYPAQVGSFLMATAPCVRFTRGTYTSVSAYATTKELLFDSGVKFTSATFSCPKARMLGVMSDYVADFTFTAADAVAHSSWFRTAQAFLKCGAPELVQDSTNHFSSTTINTTFTISKARISGSPITLTGSGWYMALDGCDIAPRSLSASWTIKFLNCTFVDRWYATQPNDVGLVPTHKLQAKISDGCVLDVDNFQWPDLYYELAIHNSLTTLDMRGKAINEVEDGFFSEIKNATINKCHVSDDTIITNCIIGDLDADSGNVNIYDSRVTITDCTPFELNVFRSIVQMNCDIDTFATKVISEDSTWELKEGGATYHRIGVQSITTANYIYDVMVGFTRCHIDNGTINGNVVSIADCVISGNCKIRAFPKKAGADFGLNVRFDRNVLSGTSSLVIGPGPNGTDNTDVYNVGISLLHIEGNIFETTDTYGLRMPFYANDGMHRFMKGSCTTTTTSTNEYGEWSQPWTYRNNSGNCPAETIPTIPDNNDSTDEEFYTTFTYSIGNDALSRRVFCIPTEENDWGSMSPGGWSLGLRGKRLAPLNNFTFMDDAGFEDKSFPSVALFPDIAMGNNARPGDEADDDMFTVRFACVDSIKSLTFKTWPVPV